MRFCQNLSLLVVLASGPFSSIATVSASDTTVSVSFPNGAKVTGLSSEDEMVDSFLGIQYGLVGERFSRSSVVDLTSSDVLNATSFGPNCHQGFPGVPEFLHQARYEDEECLYLNIWRPSNFRNTSLLSVMVWLHGGGFMIGSGADQVHTGVNLARDQGVMVISINYRLGVLGSLPQDDSGTGAMNNLWDQIVALKWIQQHVEAFGGDRNTITLFGESAGSESICMLSVSPLTRGLFLRAIMQSGECSYNHWMTGVPSESTDFALDAVEQLIEALNVTSLEDLKDKSVVSAMDCQLTMAGITGPPVLLLDREILPQHPRELYQDTNNIVPVDIVLGSNSVEDTSFMGVSSPEEYLSTDLDQFQESVRTTVGSHYSDEDVFTNVLEAYDPITSYNNDTVLALAELQGDWYIRCPTRAFAARLAESSLDSPNVYLYNFAHFAVTDPINHFGLAEFVDTAAWASHLAELPFVFGTLDFWIPETAADTTILDVDRAMSREIMTRWANFAKTGFPTNGDSDDGGIWEPVIPEPPSSADSSSSSLRSTTNDNNTSPDWIVQRLPVLVFAVSGSKTSAMATLPEKTAQCAAFPFTPETIEIIANGDTRHDSGGGSMFFSYRNSAYLWSYYLVVVAMPFGIMMTATIF